MKTDTMARSGHTEAMGTVTGAVCGEGRTGSGKREKKDCKPRQLLEEVSPSEKQRNEQQEVGV